MCGDNTQTAPFDDDLAAAIECYDKLILGEVSADEVSLHTSLDVLKDKLEKEKTVMMEYRTARLWLQFTDMIDTLRQFIKAERTGDWQLYILSPSKICYHISLQQVTICMLNLVTYTCSRWWNLHNFPQEHPDVFAVVEDVVVRNMDWTVLQRAVNAEVSVAQTLLSSLRNSILRTVTIDCVS